MHQSLARIFASVGQDGFWRSLVDGLRLLVPVTQASWEPRLLHAKATSDETSGRLGPWSVMSRFAFVSAIRSLWPALTRSPVPLFS